MNILRALQQQPRQVRKIILWLTVILVGIAFVVLWINSLKKKIERLKKEDLLPKGLNLPSLIKEDISQLKLPEIEIPVNMEIPTSNEE